VRRWRFALQPRWLGYLAMAIAFALGCVLLSRWQFDRNEEAHAEVLRIEANYDAAPVTVSSALPGLGAWDPRLKWTPVRVEGSYLVDEQLLVRNRPYNGSPGFEVLCPILLDDGRVFVVDRGWVPSGNEQDSPDAVPAPPTGRVSVMARLKPGEPELAGRSAPAGQLATIRLDSVAARLGRPVYTGAYGVLDSETPAPPERPLAAPRPELDEGPHLSYAIQWIAFALFGFFGLGYALRTEYRARHGDPESSPRPPRRSRGRSDAEVEDELLDADPRSPSAAAGHR
jgi:cytochrome oxidase assembly protein ShyY1